MPLRLVRRRGSAQPLARGEDPFHNLFIFPRLSILLNPPIVKNQYVSMDNLRVLPPAPSFLWMSNGQPKSAKVAPSKGLADRGGPGDNLG